MRPILPAVLFVVGTLAITASSSAANRAVAQYTIRAKLCQRMEGAPDNCKVLAVPTLITSNDRPAYFQTGGTVNLGGEEVDNFGTEVTLKLGQVEGDKITVRGRMELSELLGQPTNSVATTVRRRLSFSRQIEFGKTMKIADEDAAVWLELTIEPAAATAATATRSTKR